MNDAITPHITNPREIFSNLCTQSPNFPMGPNPRITDVPWIADRKGYNPGIFGLHNEILDFYNYMKPSSEEQFARDVVISRITDVVMKLWPNCEAEVVGSVKTNLYLPTSDIDMVIFGKWTALPLRTLERALLDSGLSSNITVLDKAAVPIVKMTDKDTGIQVDISFNRINSVRAVDLIRLFIKTYPYLPHLMFVLKQFLLQRHLNEVWTGGLGSYALILMVVRCLQETVPPNWPLEKMNLGALLLRFFELYGRLFNYTKAAIRVTHGGAYVRKDVILQNTVRSSILCIEDPLCPGNDVGRRSYNVMHVKNAFERAYMSLGSAVLLISNFKDCREPGSILSRIIAISEHTIKFRNRICEYGRQHMSQSSKLLNLNDHSCTISSAATAVAPFLQHPWSSNPSLYGLTAAAASFPFLIPAHPVLQAHSTLPHFANHLQLLPVTTTATTVANSATTNLIHPLPAVTSAKTTTTLTPPSADSSVDSDLSTVLHSTQTGGAARSDHSECSSPVQSTQSNSSPSVDTPVCQEKSGECTVLVEDFASLSTLINGEKGDGEGCMDQKHDSVSSACSNMVDRKRRCLRPLNPTNNGHKFEGDDDEDTNTHASSEPQQTVQTKPQDFASVVMAHSLSPTPSSGRARKHTTKMPKQTTGGSGTSASDSARDSHFPRFVNLSNTNDNNISFGQKRRVIASSRRAK